MTESPRIDQGGFSQMVLSDGIVKMPGQGQNRLGSLDKLADLTAP